MIWWIEERAELLLEPTLGLIFCFDLEEFRLFFCFRWFEKCFFENETEDINEL